MQYTYSDPDIATSPKEKRLLLQELLGTLAASGYEFTSVTPLTHERFLSRCSGLAKNIRDVFGWNLPFELKVLPPLVFKLMVQADLLIDACGYFSSKIRISSLDGDLFLHSRFPTTDTQSVFFGPDTYRFARFIKHSLIGFQTSQNYSPLGSIKPLRILDVGCGSGAGGITAVRALAMQQSYELYLNDLNPIALDYALACAQAADIRAHTLPGDFFALKDLKFDLIVSNPPYLKDPGARLYRDGGTQLGLEFSLRMVRHGLALLAPGGHLLLYTGVALTNDETNPLLSGLQPYLSGGDFQWHYEEIDPDIFGEELDQPGYEEVHRIAAAGLRVTRIK